MRTHMPLGVFSYRFTNYTVSDNGEVKEILIEAEGSIIAFYKCMFEHREVSSRFIKLWVLYLQNGVWSIPQTSIRFIMIYYICQIPRLQYYSTRRPVFHFGVFSWFTGFWTIMMIKRQLFSDLIRRGRRVWDGSSRWGIASWMKEQFRKWLAFQQMWNVST